MLVTYSTVTNRVGQAFRLTYVQGVSSDPTSKLLVLQETKPLPDGVKKASSTAQQATGPAARHGLELVMH